MDTHTDSSVSALLEQLKTQQVCQVTPTSLDKPLFANKDVFTAELFYIDSLERACILLLNTLEISLGSPLPSTQLKTVPF